MVLYWVANQWALTKTQVSISLNIDFGKKKKTAIKALELKYNYKNK
jgi:hypothetical protein